MRVSINDNILEDIADSIRTKTETTAKMHPQAMSDKIDTIVVSKTQSKSVTIDDNGTQTITPDSSYNGLSSVEITTAVPLQTKTLTVTSNGTQTIEPDTNYKGISSLELTTNVEPDLSSYFITSVGYYYPISGRTILNSIIKTVPSNFKMQSNITNYSYLFQNCSGLTSVPLWDSSACTNFSNMFEGCAYLTSVPQYNLSAATSTFSMFAGCQRLVDVPQFSCPSATNIQGMFTNCRALSTDSLNNILALCSTITLINSNVKTLYFLFGNTDMSSYYPASTIQGLSNYAAFTAAGWTIGWS